MKILEFIGGFWSFQGKRKCYRPSDITQMMRAINQNDFREDYTIIFWCKAKGWERI